MSKEVLIKGKIKTGRKLGTKLGFPTINIGYTGDLTGVFVGEIFLDKSWRLAAIHVGKKPTIDDDEVNIEVYVLDFTKKMDGEISVGKEMQIKLLHRIRDTEKFVNLEKLKTKISLDVEFVKNWYNRR